MRSPIHQANLHHVDFGSRNCLRIYAISLLGMWISQNEGAKFWLSVLTDATESEAEFNLKLFAGKWHKQYPSISKSDDHLMLIAAGL